MLKPIKCNPSKYPEEEKQRILGKVREELLALDEGGFDIYCCDEIYFRGTDANTNAWSLPNENICFK